MKITRNHFRIPIKIIGAITATIGYLMRVLHWDYAFPIFSVGCFLLILAFALKFYRKDNFLQVFFTLPEIMKFMGGICMLYGGFSRFLMWGTGSLELRIGAMIVITAHLLFNSNTKEYELDSYEEQ